MHNLHDEGFHPHGNRSPAEMATITRCPPELVAARRLGCTKNHRPAGALQFGEAEVGKEKSVSTVKLLQHWVHSEPTADGLMAELLELAQLRRHYPERQELVRLSFTTLLSSCRELLNANS